MVTELLQKEFMRAVLFGTSPVIEAVKAPGPTISQSNCTEIITFEDDEIVVFSVEYLQCIIITR